MEECKSVWEPEMKAAAAGHTGGQVSDEEEEKVEIAVQPRERPV